MQTFSHFTVICGKEVENRSVLSLVLNDRRRLGDVTSDGKLIQIVLAAATWNAQSLIVESRGMASAKVMTNN